MADQYIATLLMSGFVTHDVKRFIVSRPADFSFQPGQGVELAINQPGWQNQGRPFTPTCLADAQVLEFIIKAYPEHEGVTRALHSLPPGAELLLSEPFGTISYQGPGVFLAGGAGITPFLAILRERAGIGDIERNKLIFSNKTPADIICEKELRYLLGSRCILTCTEVQSSGFARRRIDKTFLTDTIDDFSGKFYVCGPPGFMDSVNGALQELGADPQGIVFER
jgi:ferredoxin-NADP reductase